MPDGDRKESQPPTGSAISRDELVSRYLDQIPYEPYPVQEEALLTWFSSDEGVLVCAPTGTGKTLIAEAALFEALHNQQVAYYTTPLIALTEQKFREMQEAAVRWGFDADDIGLVTGNRRVNPDARILVVVAEILLNRLLHPAAFDFSDVSAVVMDEFHSFSDPERGIVWELSLEMLPKHVRLLLLSATVGNAPEFLSWLRKSHNRKVELVRSNERKIPLQYVWVPDQLLNEQLELMAAGDDEHRKTPALVFAFNREECWRVAEQLKGKALLKEGQQKKLVEQIDKHDWSKGVGPKLKQILLRGVGVHHAGLLPRYRRIVEELFQRKLLSIAVCTETLAAGINLPARSVVLISLIKGPPNKKVLINASSAHQIFGRAGRPQYDDRGFVLALPHEDDVKIARWKEKYDLIPEDTKDPGLIKAKKRMKKKMPTRRKNEQYWNEDQFNKLIAAPPSNLFSKGPLPWRLLAYLLSVSPEVDRIHTAVKKRLMDGKHLETAEKDLNRMLLTLWAGGFVTLEPEPPPLVEETPATDATAESKKQPSSEPTGALGILLKEAGATLADESAVEKAKEGEPSQSERSTDREKYRPTFAHPTPELEKLLVFRSVNPIYGNFLIDHLGKADRDERIQAFESVLNMPGTVARFVRVPRSDVLLPGPLATEFLHPELLKRGLATQYELTGRRDEQEEEDDFDDGERTWVLNFADKMKRLFDAEFPDVRDAWITPVWAVGELLHQGGDFNKLVTSQNLVKQEGIIFRHILRFILLMDEFKQLTPPEWEESDWQAELTEIADMLTESCRSIDPESTDKMIESAHAADVVEGESHAATISSSEKTLQSSANQDDFGTGILEDV